MQIFVFRSQADQQISKCWQFDYVGSFCEIDEQVVRETRVENVVNRIQGKKRDPSVASVAERMANFFASMYRSLAASSPPGERARWEALAKQYQDFAQKARSRRAP